MKKFTIPCNFGGTKAPFSVYIGHPKEGNHPLQNQAAWLSSERGGTIPPEIMDSFSKLLDLSKKHNVDFEELCVHAMKTLAKDKEAAVAGDRPRAAAPATEQRALHEPEAPMTTPGYVPPEKKAYETPLPDKIPLRAGTHAQTAEINREQREKQSAGVGIGGGGGGGGSSPAPNVPAPQQPHTEEVHVPASMEAENMVPPSDSEERPEEPKY